MNKPIASLEITSKQLLLNIGYLIDDKIHVLYSYSEDISACMDQVSIKDKEGLIKKLNKLTSIKDDNKKIKFNIKEVVLVLPSIGLEIFKSEKCSKVISPSGIIEKNDIEGIIAQISSEPLPNVNQTLVDIIPYRFEIDGKIKFKEPPLGQKSNLLSLSALVYTLPNHIVEEYEDVILKAGLKIKRLTISSLNEAEFMSVSKDFDQSKYYIYLDLRQDVSIVNLVKNNLVYESSFFLKGINDIDDFVSDYLSVSRFNASKLRHTYGVSKGEVTNLKIKVNDEEGIKSISYKEYNAAILSAIESYCKDLKTCIYSIFDNYAQKETYVHFPLVLGGESVNTLGLEDAIRRYLSEPEEIIKIKTKVIGAAALDNLNTLGAIYVALTYRGSYQNQKPKIAQISREEDKNFQPQEEGKEVL